MTKAEQELLEAAKALLDEMLPKELNSRLGQYIQKPGWQNVTRLQAAVREIDPEFQAGRELSRKRSTAQQDEHQAGRASVL